MGVNRSPLSSKAKPASRVGYFASAPIVRLDSVLGEDGLDLVPKGLVSITFGCVDRKALLLGTALVSTLLISMVAVPGPAHAVNCIQPPPTTPILDSQTTLVCVNGDTRIATGVDAAIDLTTTTGDLYLNNSGDLIAAYYGIQTKTTGSNSTTTIVNSGDVTVSSGGLHVGIDAYALAPYSPIVITNTGALKVITSGNAYGIRGQTRGSNSDITITNSGDISVTSANGLALGIAALSNGANSSINVQNTGDIIVTAGVSGRAFGIDVEARQADSSVTINNGGDITALSPYSAGINGRAYRDNSAVSIFNSGSIVAQGTGGVGTNADAAGINGVTGGANSQVMISNSGDVVATGPRSRGIRGYSYGPNSPISITNSGVARGLGTNGIGIVVTSRGANSTNVIRNSGTAYGSYIGIASNSTGPNSKNLIYNSGDITAGSLIAIYGNDTEIFNSGKITGFVGLYGDNTFINQRGGVFETKLTSRFNSGNDLFINQAGGTVQAATNANAKETSAFQGLETFQSQGLISLQDGAAGDSFTISNTPGGKNLNFIASGNSTLAVDAFLGGPGNSSSDTFTIEGNVSGVTTVQVNNTNNGLGVFNSTGIPVVFVTGNTPTGNEFSLAKPIDTGFFDYDLFFTPTGSGFWSLKSYPGASAHLLPQLVTAAQDIWHQGSSTWFDRTADLRVLLNGGGAPAAYSPGGKSLGEAPKDNLTPAVWARGSGGWLGRDDSASTSAYGRTYNYNLDRDLQTMDFQVGLDLGKRDVLSQGDALVFGMLGGFVQANLDYNNLVRQFDFNGGQVGAYATYLKGGLFVDTLFNAHLYELDPNGTLGFPNSVDASTLGVRTDTGYRFGSFSGGAFLEPLATIEVMWANIDGFSQGGNTVSFNDDPNVRGRLGLRAGTTMQAWTGTMMQPFVIGSLWGNLSDNNQATLVSTGTTFRFQDNLQDVWGEVSAGVNFFNPSANTTVFAKVDTTFGNDLTGVGGKAGMRVVW